MLKMGIKIRPEFETIKLNNLGVEKNNMIAIKFTSLLDTMDIYLDTYSLEHKVALQKLLEAFYFVQLGLKNQADENEET
jgi:hypothetical protein